MTEQTDTGDGKGSRGARHVLWGIAFVLVILLVFSAAVQLLWNWLMPAIFGTQTITYFQAFGLLLLSRILFGRMGQRRDHAGYLTGKYGFRRLIGREATREIDSSDVTGNRSN